MAGKGTIMGAVSFKDIGNKDISKGEGVDAYGSVSLKKTDENGVTYTFKATDTTFKSLRALNGSSLTLSKPIGPITATAGLVLGSAKHFTAKLVGKWKYEKSRLLELEAVWSEKTGNTVLSLVGQPSAKLKLKNALSTNNKFVTSQLELKHKGFILAPAVEWHRGKKGVSLSHSLKGGTLKGSYALDSQIAVVEYSFKPYKISVASAVAGAKAHRPTVTLVYDKEVDLGTAARRRSGNADRARAEKVPEVSRDVPLDAKLAELDALYLPKEKAAATKLQKHKAGVK